MPAVGRALAQRRGRRARRRAAPPRTGPAPPRRPATSSTRSSWVGDEGDVRRVARGRDRLGQRAVVVEQHRLVPGDQRPADDLHPRDVRRRQRQHPRPGAAEPRGRRGAPTPAPPGATARTRLGRPVDPDVSTTIGSGSAGCGQPGVELVDASGEKSMRRTLVDAWNNRVDAHLDRARCLPPSPARSAAVVPVDPLRDRRGRLPHRQRGVLHPHRRAVRGPGRSRA